MQRTRDSTKLIWRVASAARASSPSCRSLRARWPMPRRRRCLLPSCARASSTERGPSGPTWCRFDRAGSGPSSRSPRWPRAQQILAKPGSHQVSFASGTLVVAPDGTGALVLKKLANPGSGRTYEAWVADGGAPRRAGLFGGGTTIAVPLDQPVRAGATVMVTEEKAGGTEAPSQAPFLIVRNAPQS